MEYYRTRADTTVFANGDVAEQFRPRASHSGKSLRRRNYARLADHHSHNRSGTACCHHATAITNLFVRRFRQELERIST